MQKKQTVSKNGSRAVVPQKRSETVSSEPKTKEEQLHIHVKQYLQCMGYNRTYEVFKNERPNSKNPRSSQSVQSSDAKAQLLLSFDKGNRQEFFRGMGRLLSSESTHLKLEFELHIYFCLRPILMQKAVTPDRQSGEFLKKYIEQKGNELANLSDMLCYFALPHSSRPQDVPAYAGFFKKAWVTSLRSALDSFLTSALRTVPARKSCFLLDNLCTPQEECKENCKHAGEAAQLRADSFQLANTLSALKASLQEINESSAANIRESNEKWFNFGQDLFLLVKRALKGEKVRIDRYQHFFAGTIDELIEANDISLFDRTEEKTEEPSVCRESLGRERKTTAPLLFPIDLLKIKRVIRDSQRETEACLVLRALRGRIVKQKGAAERREVVVEYERHDVLSIHEKPIAVLTANPVRRFALRLMETLVSEEYGIQYLIKSRGLISTLIGLLASDIENCSVLLSILQRFSYLKAVQSVLIEQDIIARVFALLREEQFDQYDTQFIMGLFMNLSMARHSLPRFQTFATQLVQLFLRMHAHPNEQIRNLTNGTFYLVLKSPGVAEEARKGQVPSLLARMVGGGEDESTHQYAYILRRINGEEEPQLDSEDDDEEEEEWGDNPVSPDYQEQYIDGEEDYPARDHLLFREYALLGPLAVKQHLLTLSKLQETQKKKINLTTSIVNKSRRLDNIFLNKHNATALQPQLRELLQKQ